MLLVALSTLRGKGFVPLFLFFLFLALPLTSAKATELSSPAPLRPLILGSGQAPLTITAYSSLTCSHCADFFTKVLPEIEKRYINKGKVRFIYKDFVMNGLDLRGAALAHCLAEGQAFSFLRVVYGNQSGWIHADKPDTVLTQYAQMAGLAAEGITCAENTTLLDALVAQRETALSQQSIKATPTFAFDDREHTTLVGVRSIEEFASAIDKALTAKK